MKPYQVNLFKTPEEIPQIFPAEPIFVYGDKRYLNFTLFDFRNLKNNEFLKETARLTIDQKGTICGSFDDEAMQAIKKAMAELKKLESVMLFPDTVSALFALLSIFESKTVFFIDYETSPSIQAVLSNRNLEFYHHQDLDQLSKLLTMHTEKGIIIDGLYEWLGYTGPVGEIVNLAKQHGAVIIANEINSFGLLGRDGRGFTDLYYLYDDINIEIGSFDRLLGGFGAYIGAKRYLINNILEKTNGIYKPMPKFMVAVNLACVELLKHEKNGKAVLQKLWSHSRYFINRLKQMGLKTRSETPIIVVLFNNNDEAKQFSDLLLNEGIIVDTQRERVRFTISVEHSKTDLDYTLDKIEAIKNKLGI